MFIECSDKDVQAFHPGHRTILDAHNCYPYHGKWADRIDRALKCGLPIAIEQDLVWYTDSLEDKSWSIVSHGGPCSGNEPTLRSYFFERIRPIIEKAIQSGETQNWPLIVLNLDFKTNEAEHHRAVWNLLGEYEDWLCTAEKVQNVKTAVPVQLRPVLVLTGDDDSQEDVFFNALKDGEKLRLFGAVHAISDRLEIPPGIMVTEGATNYRRWWNNSWKVIERDRKNSSWTAEDNERLKSLVTHAHQLGLWIRFYTLNGHEENESLGWDDNYNFGSLERVKIRWSAAIEAGVDFLAVDQYELFKEFHLAKQKLLSERSPL